MSRLLANCSTTTTSSSSGSVTTICDCDCEGCCCQHLTFSAHGGGDMWVDFDWHIELTPSSPLLACLGITGYPSDSMIANVDVYFDYCPPYPDPYTVPADLFFGLTTDGAHPPEVITGPPIIIPDAGDVDCITFVFSGDAAGGRELFRCTAKLTL